MGPRPIHPEIGSAPCVMNKQPDLYSGDGGFERLSEWITILEEKGEIDMGTELATIRLARLLSIHPWMMLILFHSDGIKTATLTQLVNPLLLITFVLLCMLLELELGNAKYQYPSNISFINDCSSFILFYFIFFL